MSKHDTTSDANPPAEAITDFADLYPRQTAHHRYTVLNLSGDSPTAYQTDIDELDCTCQDAEYNRSGGEICKHLATALLSASNHVRVEEDIITDLVAAMNEVHDARRDLRDAIDTAEDLQGSGSADSADTDSQDDSEDSESEDMDSGENYSELTPTDAQAGMCTAVYQWIASAEQFDSDIDPEIVECKWIEIQGREGVWVDRAPFYGDAEYYDDGEWQDQDGFEAAQEAIGNLLSNRDEFEWHGEPDYVWFIPESQVDEVVG